MSSEQQFFKERPETNVFVQVLQKYLPFWPLFALTIPIALLFSYLYFRSQIPVYVAQAKVLLKDPNKSSGDSKVLDALNIFGEKKIVENEIIVLRSSSLMKEVVKNLDLYATVFNEGKVREEELYGYNSPVWFKAILKDSIFIPSRHYFKMNWNNNSISFDGKVIPFGSTVNVNNVLYQVIDNPIYSHFLIGKNYFVHFNSVEGAAEGIIGYIRASALSTSSTPAIL